MRSRRRTSARRTSARRAAPLVGAVLVLASCGVPLDDAATPTPVEDVPFDLLSVTTTSVATGTPEGGETTICLSVDGSLFSLGRDRAGDPPLDSLMALATAGPTEGEATLGLRSAVEGEDVIADVRRVGSGAEVDLGTAFAELPADQQLLAVAQVTCTLTSQPGVDGVRFLIDDEEVEVPVAGGELVARAVTRADYERLVAN